MNATPVLTNPWRRWGVCLALLTMLALVSCAGIPTTAPTAAPPSPVPPTAALPNPTQPAVALPNPASAYCGEQGGKLEIRTGTDGGQYGVCVFPNGSECEEWAFFRGECAPAEMQVSTDDLLAQVGATVPQDAFRDGGLKVLPLTVPAGWQKMWAVYTSGMRNYDKDPVPSHLIALYQHAATGWEELARLELTARDSDALAPDYVDASGVTQVQIDPSDTTWIWLQVYGGAGAHSGTYQLISFDGVTMKVEISAFSPSPGMGGVQDINGDGVAEVVVDATDPYVFCYACGVRKIGFQVYAWDKANARLVEMTLQPMLMGQQGHPARVPTNRAVELAEAGLWKDALAKITEARQAAAAAKEPTDNWTLDWDYALIKLNADALAGSIADSAYPLLADVFYGDYAAALDLMRPYSAADLFKSDSPLIAGAVADGWLPELTGDIITSATSALAVAPDLAAAYFLRGWAEYLAGELTPQARADVAHAAVLAPSDALITQGADYVAFLAAAQSSGPAPTVAPAPVATPAPTPFVPQPGPQATRVQFAPGATSATVQGQLAAGAIAEYVLRASANQWMMVSVYSPKDDVWLEISGVQDGQPLLRAALGQTTWSGVLPGTQDYLIKAVSMGGATSFTLSVIIPQRIQFAAGATSATLTGQLAAHETDEYVLRAMAGQTMTVAITAPNNDVLVEIYGIEDGQPLVRTVMGLSQWTGVLPATQDYDVKAVSVGGATSYTMKVTIE